MMLNLARQLRQLLDVPIRPARVRLKRKQFFTPEGFCDYFGVFESFDAARAWLPHSLEFDHPALAQGYDEHTRHVFAYDYPMMWWLQQAFRGGASTVLDIGGSFGVHYYAYRRYLQMPDDLIWQVVEVPAMVAVGREFAALHEAIALRFTVDLKEAGRYASIWLSAGALQYIDEGRIDRLLQMSGARPPHILINKLPIFDGSAFVTAQNIGHGCYAPVQVFSRKSFVSEIEALGYMLIEEWKVHERSLLIPGHPELFIQAFSGFYFSRPDSTLEAPLDSPSRGCIEPALPAAPLVGRVHRAWSRVRRSRASRAAATPSCISLA